MAKKTDRARAAGTPGRGHLTAHGESQRESSARMAGPRVANRKRFETASRQINLGSKGRRGNR